MVRRCWQLQGRRRHWTLIGQSGRAICEPHDAALEVEEAQREAVRVAGERVVANAAARLVNQVGQSIAVDDVLLVSELRRRAVHRGFVLCFPPTHHIRPRV